MGDEKGERCQRWAVGITKTLPCGDSEEWDQEWHKKFLRITSAEL